MLSNFLRDNSSQRYLIVDFETTNTNQVLSTNRVWQVGLVQCKGKNIIQQDEIFIRWNPLNISKGAAQVTKFDIREYNEKAVDPKEPFDMLTSYLYDKDYRIIFHNGLGFEVYLYNIWRKLMGYKSDWSYLSRTIDTDALARGIKKGIKYQPGDNFLAYQYRMSSIIEKGLKTNLTALGKENKIEYDYENLHRALNDCILNKLVWEKYISYQVDI